MGVNVRLLIGIIEWVLFVDINLDIILFFQSIKLLKGLLVFDYR